MPRSRIRNYLRRTSKSPPSFMSTRWLMARRRSLALLDAIEEAGDGMFRLDVEKEEFMSDRSRLSDPHLKRWQYFAGIAGSRPPPSCCSSPHCFVWGCLHAAQRPRPERPRRQPSRRAALHRVLGLLARVDGLAKALPCPRRRAREEAVGSAHARWCRASSSFSAASLPGAVISSLLANWPRSACAARASSPTPAPPTSHKNCSVRPRSTTRPRTRSKGAPHERPAADRNRPGITGSPPGG